MKKKVDKKIRPKKKAPPKKVVKTKKPVDAKKKAVKKSKPSVKPAVKATRKAPPKVKSKPVTSRKKAPSLKKKEPSKQRPVQPLPPVENVAIDKDSALLKKRSDLEIEVDDEIVDEDLDIEIEEELKDLEAIDEGIDRSAKDLLVEQILAGNNNHSIKEIVQGVKDLDFFGSDTDDCLERGCDNPSSTLGYCRFHYIKNWEIIKHKQEVLSQNELVSLIDKVLRQNTINNLESILTDLTDDKSFFNALKELDIDALGQPDDEEELEEEEDVEFETAGPKDLDMEEE